MEDTRSNQHETSASEEPQTNVAQHRRTDTAECERVASLSMAQLTGFQSQLPAVHINEINIILVLK
jgi:hypothetical protein